MKYVGKSVTGGDVFAVTKGFDDFVLEERAEYGDGLKDAWGPSSRNSEVQRMEMEQARRWAAEQNRKNKLNNDGTRYRVRVTTGKSKSYNPYATYSKEELQKIKLNFEQHLRDEERNTGSGLRGNVANANVREFNRQLKLVDEALRRAT